MIQRKQYRMGRIIFDKKMITQLQRGRSKAILNIDMQDEQPVVGKLYYVAEPFIKLYVEDKGMVQEERIIYSDDSIKHQTDIEVVDYEGFSPLAMQEYQARYFLRIVKSQVRILKSLSCKDAIYKNLLSMNRKDRVYYISFELVSKDEIEAWYEEQEREEWLSFLD